MTIDLYTWTTPNGRKASVMLEELGLEYTVHPINIGKGEQFQPHFLKVSPNNRIPALVDSDGPGGEPVSVFESAAILLYLGEKHGRFIPADPRRKIACYEWLMWQMGGVGPMFGQVHHFRRAAKEEVPYAIKRYTDETHRLYGVADKRLAEAEWFAGEEYSIADMAVFPWMARHEWHATDLADYPNVRRWYRQMRERPAVARGMNVPPVDDDPMPD